MIGAGALALAQAQEGSITLDPEAMNEVWMEVVTGKPAKKSSPNSPPSATQTPLSRLMTAQNHANLSVMVVEVLTALQELNPLMPMGAHGSRYAEALEVFRLAYAGQSEASGALATAFRKGVLSNGLLLVKSETAADYWERRASSWVPAEGE